MTTTRETSAMKATRQARQRRALTPDKLGSPCRGRCGLRMPIALENVGILAHPTCGPEWPYLVRAGAATR